MTDKAYSCFDTGYYAAKRQQGFILSIGKQPNTLLCRIHLVSINRKGTKDEYGKEYS